jgi:hypothetical protein
MGGQDLISGEPNQSEAGRDMGKPSCTGGRSHKTEAEEENPRRRRVQRVADSRVVLRTQGRRSLATERRTKPWRPGRDWKKKERPCGEPAACDGEHTTGRKLWKENRPSPDESTSSVGSWEAVDER